MLDWLRHALAVRLAGIDPFNDQSPPLSNMIVNPQVTAPRLGNHQPHENANLLIFHRTAKQAIKKPYQISKWGTQ